MRWNAAVMILLVTALLSLPSSRAEAGEAGIDVTIAGVEKAFPHAPAEENFYNSISSGIRSWASPGSTEQFSLTFMSMDLAKFDYPVDLPPTREPGKPLDMSLLMATVGFSYTNEEGMEWAGPGKVTIESFGDDGVLSGRIKASSLPQVDDRAPDIAIDGGRFRVKLR